MHILCGPAGGTATARRGRTGQLVTANRISRLGTASMMPHSAAFINTARLNLGHCASVRATVKSLFEYLYFVAGDVRKVRKRPTELGPVSEPSLVAMLGTGTGQPGRTDVVQRLRERPNLLEMCSRPLFDAPRSGASGEIT